MRWTRWKPVLSAKTGRSHEAKPSKKLGESGILDALVAKGVQENDTILIGDYQFDYIF